MSGWTGTPRDVAGDVTDALYAFGMPFEDVEFDQHGAAVVRFTVEGRGFRVLVTEDDDFATDRAIDASP